MIELQKHELAMYAIHRVFVEARLMAYESVNQSKIATFLDIAELLPRYVAVAEDKTSCFRALLVDLANERPHISAVLRRFDESAVPRW